MEVAEGHERRRIFTYDQTCETCFTMELYHENEGRRGLFCVFLLRNTPNEKQLFWNKDNDQKGTTHNIQENSKLFGYHKSTSGIF